MEGSGDILALSELITGYHNAYDEEVEEEERAEQNRLAKLTPSTIGGSAINEGVARPIGQIKAVDPKAIWDLDEVPSDDEDDEVYETRSRPQFEILYKQSVMTEDVFLGLSDKDPSFANCEALVVRVECPRHRLEDIELDVKKQKLLLQSPTLGMLTDLLEFGPPCRKLSLFLPHPVQYQDGHAKWDQNKQSITISLPIIRDEW